MGNGQTDDSADRRDVLRCECFAGRQTEHALGQSLGFRQRCSGLGIQIAVRRHAVTAREEVAPGFYVFGVKHAYQVIPADTAVRLVHVENHILEVGALCFADWRERDSWYAGELVLDSAHSDGG